MFRNALMLMTVLFSAVFFYFWYVRGENILFEQQRPTDDGLYTYATRLPADRPSTREPGPRWESMANMPTMRTDAVAAAVGGKIYVMGGRDSFGRDVDAVEVLDTTTGTWAKSVPLPEALHAATAVNVGGVIYLIGGLQGVTGHPVDAAYAYRPATAEWQAIAKPPRAVGAAAVVAQGSEIHLFGGRTALGSAPHYLVYDTEKDAWKEGEEMLTSVEASGAGVVDKTFYVYGGRAGSSLENSRRTESYQVTDGHWTRHEEMPVARSGFGYATIKGVLYAFGGKAPTVTVRTVDAFDTATDTWTTLGEMPTPRYGAATAIVDGKVYLIGGSPRPVFSVSDVVDVFIP